MTNMFDEDAQEEGDAGVDGSGNAASAEGGAEGGPDGAQGDGGDGDGNADGADAENGDAAGAEGAEEAEAQGPAAGTSADAARPAEGAGLPEGQDKPGTSGAAAGGGGTQLDGTSRTWRQRQAHVVEPFAKADIARINFDAGAVRNRAASKASGRKRHRGPPPLQGSALLARIERKPLPLPPPGPEAAAGKHAEEAGAGAEGGKDEEEEAAAGAGGKDAKDAKGSGTNAPKHPPSFPVWVVSGGQLLEVNERLAADPGLLLERPCREGYLALLYPTKEQAAGLRRRLLSEAQYLALRGLTAEDLL
ncbi:hypothetical protein HYH02_001134 [Chlamydomonas schloesseri]|uniref:Protein Abitram n=1 Tax=Chlamydomonas schloesseri TaxID=2026947 RepID=A0A835WXE3_9CHLO|nr:hypothetical protein HYH02_001134 [Chlamydomonas schloesseri]|eukprot:KAG2454095.1 hypothetical protein HYH02_001134 [Chlamydomonas schloesseri]